MFLNDIQNFEKVFPIFEISDSSLAKEKTSLKGGGHYFIQLDQSQIELLNQRESSGNSNGTSVLSKMGRKLLKLTP